MYKDYDVYKLAIKILNDDLASIVRCQQDIINFYQAQIDAIKVNYLLTEEERNHEIEKYMASIDGIHNLLKSNNIIINLITDKTSELSNNIDSIINYSTSRKQPLMLEEKIKQLKEVVLEESSKIYRIADESKNLLLGNDDDSEIKRVFSFECQKLARLAGEVHDMLESIPLSSNNDYNVEIEEQIKKIIRDEHERSNVVSREANRVLSLSLDKILHNTDMQDFCNNIQNEYDKLMSKISDLEYIKDEINLNNPSKVQKVALNLISEVMEEEARRINSSLLKIVMLLDKQNSVDSDHSSQAKKVLDEESKRLEEYSVKINSLLNELNNENANVKDILSRLAELSLNENERLEEVNEKIGLALSATDTKEKERDTVNYKKYCSILNKSFWEARQKASDEHIKYPSALYEQKVKEYQNDYLITNYNVSLEEAQDEVITYEEKYFEDLYIDKIYNQAVDLLCNESDATIQELCDESAGLSLVDQKVYSLLELDLSNVIRDIGNAKNSENTNDSLAVNEYHRSYEVGKLLDKKNMIERQMRIIKNRAKKLEKDS